MNHATEADPILDAMIEAEVDEALHPYEAEGVYQPEELLELRRMLRVVMRTHPTAVHLLQQLRPPAAHDRPGPAR